MDWSLLALHVQSTTGMAISGNSKYFIYSPFQKLKQFQILAQVFTILKREFIFSKGNKKLSFFVFLLHNWKCENEIFNIWTILKWKTLTTEITKSIGADDKNLPSNFFQEPSWVMSWVFDQFGENPHWTVTTKLKSSWQKKHEKAAKTRERGQNKLEAKKTEKGPKSMKTM